jgi:hypothetical protein
VPSPLTLPVRYTRQKPPMGTPLRRSGPIGGSLVWFACPGAGNTREYVTNRRGTPRGAITFDAGKLGTSARNGGDGGNGITWPVLAGDPITTLTTRWTVVCWAGNTDTAQTQGNHIVFALQGATGWAPALSLHSYYFNNAIEVTWCKDGFNAESYTGGTFALGQPLTQWVWVRDGTTHTLYRDGGNPTVLTTTGNAAAAQALDGPATILGRFDSTYATVENGLWGDCPYTAVLDRALSPGEVRRLYLSPYQCF